MPDEPMTDEDIKKLMEDAYVSVDTWGHCKICASYDDLRRQAGGEMMSDEPRLPFESKAEPQVALRKPYFEGPKEDDEPARTARLSGQILDIYNVMQRGLQMTLREIEVITGHPQASISAQLRHLRKKRFGGFTVEKEHIGNGLYVYWMSLKCLR